MSNDLIRVGTVTGTGAAINISLGWIPDYVKVVNLTDGDTIDEWFRGNGAATSIRTVLAVATNAANGISEYAGTEAGVGKGFTIGSAISESAKVLNWFALRNDAQPYNKTYP